MFRWSKRSNFPSRPEYLSANQLLKFLNIVPTNSKINYLLSRSICGKPSTKKGTRGLKFIEELSDTLQKFDMETLNELKPPSEIGCVRVLLGTTTWVCRLQGKPL